MTPLADGDTAAPESMRRRTAVAVGIATAGAGIGLVVAPRLFLRILGAGRAEPAPFLFRVVGMFMVVSGGLLTDGAASSTQGRLALRWSFVAKVGAASAVVLGVRSGRFGKQALALAVFDGAAAGLVASLIVEEA